MPTLLLADDSITVQRVIALTFANEQIRVVAVSDGTQAVERMKTLHPDIVLAGTVLPQVSGYDLAKHMRTIPGLRNVPVLLLTGAFETVDEEKLKASGANGILEKPVEPNNVIARVKELLGLKSEAKPATAGRLVTSADATAENPLPIAGLPRAVTSTIGTASKRQQPVDQTGLAAGADPVEGSATRSDDYLDTLDAAFDTLDQQLSGRVSADKPSRNPSGPLGQSSGAPDPRSPGRRPEGGASTPAAGNPVFEVDDDWFGGDESQARADARAGRREVEEDLTNPELRASPVDTVPAGAVFEVDDNWFAEADKARAASLEEHRRLAVEMGVHDVGLPRVEPEPNATAPQLDNDFDFGLDDIKNLQQAAPAVETSHAPEAAPAPQAPETPEAPQAPEAPHAPQAPQAPQAPEAPQAPQAPQAPIVPTANMPAPASESSAASGEVADEFAQLLAFEQGERPAAVSGPRPEVQLIAPEVTAEMLDQVAARVAERLSTGGFGEQLMHAMTATVRDTVREIASATSERVVREVATEASDRLVREIATEASERLGREIAAEMSERLVRGIASETAERLSREIAMETSERLSREIVTETSQRLSREIATEASERLSREIATETSERLAREIATEASDRVSREIASETAERLVREIAAETSARVARDVVSETSERLVRDEIERIKSKARS